MLDDSQGFEAKDMELLRLILRACDYSTEMFSKVILACHGHEFPEVAHTMSKLRELLQEMEGQPTSEEQLMYRIAEAKPENPISF